MRSGAKSYETVLSCKLRTTIMFLFCWILRIAEECQFFLRWVSARIRRIYNYLRRVHRSTQGLKWDSAGKKGTYFNEGRSTYLFYETILIDNQYNFGITNFFSSTRYSTSTPLQRHRILLCHQLYLKTHLPVLNTSLKILLIFYFLQGWEKLFRRKCHHCFLHTGHSLT